MRSKRWFWLLAALFLLALAARALPGPRTIDDAYITFRYARNLLAGEGFVFNPGERVLGTTTPLYTLLLAALGLLAGGTAAPFPALALGLNALADAISAVLLVWIGRQLGGKWAAWGAGLAWAIAPFSVAFAIGGLETSLYLLLLLATFGAYLDKRYAAGSFFAALSLLTRPDALLLILPLALDRLLFDPKRRGQSIGRWEILAFLLPLLAWLAFAWPYFGNPLPHSLIAKSEVYLLPSFSALIRFLQHFATPFQGHLSFGLPWIRIGLLLYPFLALLGARQAFKKQPAAWSFAAFPWLYLAAFAIANPLVFRWYLAPPLPFYMLFILLGAESLLGAILAWLNMRRRVPSWISAALLAALILAAPFSLLLADWQLQPEHGPSRAAPSMAWIELELLYQQVAERLDPLLLQKEAATLAAGDVGVLAYFTGAKILDLAGLNSPQALDYYPLPITQYGDFVYAVSSELVLDERPDYVVILEVYGRQTLLKNAEFRKSYALFFEIPTDIYGSRGMLIFQRLD